MELVGVRNIELSDELPFFTIDSGTIYKVQSWSVNYLPSNGSNRYIKLNNNYIYYQYTSDPYTFQSPTPFYLDAGYHSVDHYENDFSITLYGLEFKLTTQ